MLALAVILPGLVWLALAGWAAVTGRVGLAIGLVVANVAAFVVWLPPDVYANFGSADRASVGLALAAVLAVPLLRGFPPLWNRLVPSALALLTLGWTIVSAGLALGM